MTKKMLDIFDEELATYLTLHPPIAKRALYCLCALHPEEKDEILLKMIEETEFDRFDDDQFITRLVLLGHMIEICPKALENIGKQILVNICKFLLENETKTNRNDDDDDEVETMKKSFSKTNFTLLPDEPHADPEISAETRVKRELIKAMSRAVLALGEHAGSLFTLTYKLIRKSMEKDQNFTSEMTENEIIYIRLCGLSCLLKLISHSFFYTRIKPEDFLLIMTLLRDPSSTIRQRTYRKLAERLRDPTSPVEFLALLAFAAKEPEREHREQIRRLMLQIIDTRRENIKLQLSYKTASNCDDVEEKAIDYTLYPEYSLTYFLYFLSKSPAFILYDDLEMLHTMTDYILFLLDALLLRCDTTVGLFYKGLLRSIKSSEDATISPDKEEKAERKDALKKLHVLVDLTYVILSQRASSLMICRANSDVPLPELYFIKTRYNQLSYLPKDFKIKLKSITTTNVSDVVAKHQQLNQTESSSSSSINVVKSHSAKSNRKKQTNVDEQNQEIREENSTKRRRSLPTTNRKRQRVTIKESDDEDEETHQDSSIVEIQRKRIDRSSSSSLSS